MALPKETPEVKTPKQKLWDLLKTLLKIGFTGFLLWLVLRKMNFQEVKRILQTANPLYLLLAVATYFASILFAASRLLSFFRSIHLHLGRKFNMRLYMLGLFYNLFLPGGIGGDGYKIWLLNKTYKKPAKKVFWAILFDRLSGLWAIGLITVALVAFIPQIEISPILIYSVFVVGTGIYYAVAHYFFKEYTHNFWSAHAKAVAVQSLQVVTILCILMALNFNGKYSPYLFTFLVSSLSAIFPFTVGGLGAREFVFTHFSGYFHMNSNLAVVVSLLFYLTSAIVSLGGLYYVFRSDKLQEGLPQDDDDDNDEAKPDAL
ncbi:MAG: flippase-like domain-containing protein [Sphingobacteriaceae bacterium]|nr:MAG: flippase-like domain-containing protein [Sphingobacteriaceae bacterium]